MGDPGSIPGSGSSLEKEMAIHSSNAWKMPWTRSLVGYSPWGRKESDTTERLHFHFLLGKVPPGLIKLNAIYLVNILVLGNYYLGPRCTPLRG